MGRGGRSTMPLLVSALLGLVASTSAAALADIGNNGSCDPGFSEPCFPLSACQGDCDNDGECGAGLYCFQRSGGEAVPGCDGADPSGTDYCFDRPADLLWAMGNNGLPLENFPLGACEGDCDSDAECDAGLTCMQRSNGEHVWGCYGEDGYNLGSDVCFDPNLMPTGSPTTPGPTVSPTLRPSRSPALPTLEVERPLEMMGNPPPVWAIPLDACQGDCDNDDECKEGLMCFHSKAGSAIPGCIGTAASTSDDYCFERPPNYLYNMGNNGLPLENFPLGLCEGDCDSDAECDGDLRCFMFDAPEEVPGCVGTRGSWEDYCWERPSNYLWTSGNNWEPPEAFPLGECEGDCDRDEDCGPGLKCFHRTYGEDVLGCVGLASSDTTDYCFDPTLTDQPTDNPSLGPTAKPTNSPTKSPSTSPTDSPTTAEPTNAPTLDVVASVVDREALVSAFGCADTADARLWPRAVDSSTEKHLCDRAGLGPTDPPAGIIFLPSHGRMSVVHALRVYSHNDCSGCDPVGYVLEGRAGPTDDDDGDPWTVVGGGDLPWTDVGRNARGLDVSSTYEAGDMGLVYAEASFGDNAAEYLMYRLTFVSTRDPNSGSVQFAEVELPGVLYGDGPPAGSPPDPSFVQAVACPPEGTSKALVSGYKVARPAAAGSFCGVFVERADGALVPYARSYDGFGWEASPGPHAIHTDDISCYAVDCDFALPDLEDGSGDRYTILSKGGDAASGGRRLAASDARKDIARFLEMLTFGPRKSEVDALDDGSWGEAARARYVRDQIDMDMSGHREHYRRRVNAKHDATTHQARSNHPCSPNSKWVRYSYAEQDMFRTVSGEEKVTTFETVPAEAGTTVAIYEANFAGQVSAFGSGAFKNDRGGVSGSLYYDFSHHLGDFLEFTVTAEAGTKPVSFRYMNGSKSFNGNRPCQLWVNGAMVAAAYDFVYTDSYSYWMYSDLVDVALVAGQNTIRLVVADQGGGPNIDHLRVGKPPAMVMRTDGWPRAIARSGVGLLKTWDFVFANGTAVTFDDYPKPPQGDLYAYDYGRLNVILPDGSENNYLDIGNPPVDFTGYEQYLDELPHGYFAFDGTETWDETASDLFDYPLRRDQELLLRQGSDDPLCDLVPAFSGEGDAPVFGRLADGSWLRWTPTVQLEDNGPSINVAPGDMAAGVLSDGGGESSAETGGKLRCSNVARSFVNEATCFLSTASATCPSAEVDHADASAGIIVCGSVGEVANDPSLPETFAIETEEHSVTDSDKIENQKSVVWTEIGLFGPDQMRQRMAWALAQIVTTVPENIDARDQTEVHVNFYDTLVRNAFGNYRDILREASYSPLMGEHLSYYRSKSHAFVYQDDDKKISRADENYAREIMQLFSIGLIELNDDGTLVLDPATGSPIETYTNGHIESFARAWTGFDRADPRGNYEQERSVNRLDPMKIEAKWRDPFPKPDLYGGFVGDGYILCADLPVQSFLKAGARYRLLGGSPLPELMKDPSEFADAAYSILRVELSSSSALYQKLHNGGSYELAVELDTDLVCSGTECEVDTVRVVKVGSVYYEFVERPCVQLGFYDNGKQIQLRENARYGTMCANPDLAHAREACCREDRYKEVRYAFMESNVTYKYEGERMTYATANGRCVDYGKDLCLFETVKVLPSDNSWRKGYHWTNKDCSINVKVNTEGQIAIVHDAKSTYADNIPFHVEEENTLNWFRVNWSDGVFPGSSDTNTCASNNCKTMPGDGSCLCKTTVSESVVFTDLDNVSKDAVMSQLFIGTIGPQDGTTDTTHVDGVTVHMVGDIVDGNTVFEVEDKGRTFYLKNALSTVNLEGWTLQPQIYEAEDANFLYATAKGSVSSTGGSYVELGNNSSSYVEWNVNVPHEGKYLVSFRYAFDSSPKRMDIDVNGYEILHAPVNNETTIVWYGSSPSSDHLPLQRCEGDCDNDDQCEPGLFCMQNGGYESVPGCNGNQNNGGDYCVDFADFTSVGFLPTGGSTGDWHYSEPLEVDLIAGSNTIRAQIPDGHLKGPNLDHLRVEGLPTASTSSFRNPPHFMSLVHYYEGVSAEEVGEITLRDAQYETEAVIDNYFYHDNVAPFLCSRIMQRFSFSNPSPGFVGRCVQAFRSGTFTSGLISFGSNEYGSLEAMAASIFLDIEANDAAVTRDPSYGSMREPILKVMNVLRSMEYQTHIPTTLDGSPMQTTYHVDLWEIAKKIGQGAYDFPSVFSYFLPEYIPESGPTLPASLVSPETMLVTMPNVMSLLNGLISVIKFGLSSCNDGFSSSPGYGDCNDDGLYEKSFGHLFYEPSGASLTDQADDLALLLTAGRLSDGNRDVIVAACSPEPDQRSQVRCMQQLLITTAEFQTTNAVTPSGEDRGAPQEFGDSGSTEPYKAIVYYYLSGGLDSYNLLAPHTCANGVYEKYRTIRGKSGLSEGIGLPLSRQLEIQVNNPSQPCSSFGIHENFPVLQELYNEGKLNFIANAGLLSKPLDVNTYKDESWRSKLYSHNRMTLETKKEDLFDEFAGTGVGGRLADVMAQAGIPTNTFSISGQQVVLTGGPVQYILSDGGLSPFNEEPSINNMEAIIKSLNNGTTADSGFYAETWSSKLVDMFDKQAMLEAELAEITDMTVFPEDSGTANKFKMVTRLMQTAEERGSKRDIFYVSTSGFDTHSNVDLKLIEKFTDMNAAIGAFVAELKALNLWEQTVLVQFSEFGRTLNPNTGEGSDHAWGGNHFMFGGAVAGGQVLGQYPSNFEEGDEEGIMLSRGRMIPTTPWDGMWLGVSEWFGVPSNSPEMEKVLPLHTNFPSEKLYGKDDLFDVLGSGSGGSTS